MPLKAILQSLDDVDEALRSHYKQQDDVYVLAVDGIDDHPSVKNLKSAHERTKADLKKAKDSAADATAKLEAYGETTPDDIEELRHQAEKGGKAPTKEEIDAMVEDKWKIAQQKFTKQIEALQSENAELKTSNERIGTQLADERIFTKIKDSAVQAGVRPKAIQIVADMAKPVWRLGEDGQPMAFKGDEPMMGSTGPVTMDDWVASLRDDHDYLFGETKGSGAQGGGDGGGNRPQSITLQGNAIGQNLKAFADGSMKAKA